MRTHPTRPSLQGRRADHSPLGPLGPGRLWPPGPRSGSPPRAPHHPRDSARFRGATPPPRVILPSWHLLGTGQRQGEITERFSDQLCCYSFQKVAPAAPAGAVPAPRPPAWAGGQVGQRPQARGSHSCRRGRGHGRQGPRSEPSLRHLERPQWRRRACGGVSSAGSAFWKKTPGGGAQTEKRGRRGRGRWERAGKGGLGEHPAPAHLAFASSPLGSGWQESTFTTRQVAACRRKPGQVPPHRGAALGLEHPGESGTRGPARRTLRARETGSWRKKELALDSSADSPGTVPSRVPWRAAAKSAPRGASLHPDRRPEDRAVAAQADAHPPASCRHVLWLGAGVQWTPNQTQSRGSKGLSFPMGAWPMSHR